MSARGHRPRTSETTDVSRVVGGVAHFGWAGVGDYSQRASQDPADIIGFDLMVDEWLAAGLAVDPGTAYGLAAEYRRARR